MLPFHKDITPPTVQCLWKQYSNRKHKELHVTAPVLNIRVDGKSNQGHQAAITNLTSTDERSF